MNARPPADPAGLSPAVRPQRTRSGVPFLTRGVRSIRTLRTDRYGLVLSLLVFGFLLSAFTSDTVFSIVRLLLFLTTLLLALHTSQVRRVMVLVVMLIALVGATVTSVSVLAHEERVGLGLLNAWLGLVLLVVVLVIVRRILTHPVVNLQTILGALSAYLIIGMMFAACYGALNQLEGGFFARGAAANSDTLQYFSFTTLTTLGYGDFTAATTAGRTIAVLEALIGQIFLVTLVAGLVSGFRPGRGREREPGRARSAFRRRPTGQRLAPASPADSRRRRDDHRAH